LIEYYLIENNKKFIPNLIKLPDGKEITPNDNTDSDNDFIDFSPLKEYIGSKINVFVNNKLSTTGTLKGVYKDNEGRSIIQYNVD